MEFWGVEVKPNQSLKCAPPDGKLLYITQAALGESKVREKNNIPIFVEINGQKLVLGNLSLEKCAQIKYDLVFEKEFELSHASKTASVYFSGYADLNDGGNHLVPVKANKAKAEDDDSVDYSVDDSDDSTESEESDARHKGFFAEMPSDSDESSDEDVKADLKKSVLGNRPAEPPSKTPIKSALGKRPADSPSKTPLPEKKAKIVTPAGEKTGHDGKKSVVHVATPYPHKKQASGKTAAANSEKSKLQTSKSAGSVSCRSCNRNFKSKDAFEAHNKAKHG